MSHTLTHSLTHSHTQHHTKTKKVRYTPRAPFMRLFYTHLGDAARRCGTTSSTMSTSPSPSSSPSPQVMSGNFLHQVHDTTRCRRRRRRRRRSTSLSSFTPRTNDVFSLSFSALSLVVPSPYFLLFSFLFFLIRNVYTRAAGIIVYGYKNI